MSIFTKEQKEQINKQVGVVKEFQAKVEIISMKLREEVLKLKNMGGVSGSTAQDVLNGINLLRGEWYGEDED